MPRWSARTTPLANLGILAYRAGKAEETESWFKRYLAAEPGDAQGWVNLGLLYVARSQTNPADAQAAAAGENALRKALQIDPGSAPAYKALGRLLAATGCKREALDAYQRSLALNVEQPDVRQQVEHLAWESGGARFPGIADDFRTRSAGGQDSDAPAPIIVLRLLDQGQFQQAEAICLEWTEQEPKSPLAWSLLERACERQGHAEDARRARAQLAALMKP
jgi:Tfp pilus assembly protein PilF